MPKLGEGGCAIAFLPQIRQARHSRQKRYDSESTLRGQIHLDRYELLNPKVQLCGEAAVLTHNFVGYPRGTGASLELHGSVSAKPKQLAYHSNPLVIDQARQQ
ncbi:MAG: hypothetical protein ABSD57_10425 [Verrucomicrobiota bacterium]